MSERPTPDRDAIPDRLLASALEFAVGIAAAGAKLRPALPFPNELKPYLRFHKLPPKALAPVRAAVESDELFRSRLGMVANAELVDEAGILWLARPDGWSTALDAMLVVDDAPVDLATELRRADRRREAAEQVAQRSLAEIAALRAEVDRLAQAASRSHADHGGSQKVVADLRAANEAMQTELRHAQDRVAGANQRADAAKADAIVSAERASAAERVRDDVLATRAARIVPPAEGGFDPRPARAALEEAAQTAASLARRLETAAGAIEVDDRGRSWPPADVARRSHAHPVRGGNGRRSSPARRPIALPGGVFGDSAAAAEHLVRVPGVVVLLDGYNVAMLGWPQLLLEQQRLRCIETAENVARRFGTNVSVIFDGSSVPGAVATARRLVRVRFSPAGVIADDVLRAEVDELPAATPAVVVTNDQAVVNDVRQRGVNVMPSDQWLDLATR